MTGSVQPDRNTNASFKGTVILICANCGGEYWPNDLGGYSNLDARVIAGMVCVTCPNCNRDLALVEP